MIEVHIDLNVRCGTGGQLTFSGVSDIQGDFIPHAGTSVLAVEPESNLAAPAVVVAFNAAAMLIYLAVAWREMKDKSLYHASFARDDVS